MYEDDSDIKSILESAELTTDPDAERMRQVQERMMAIARRSQRPRRRRHRVLAATGILFAGAAVAVAGTKSGRDLVRWMFTPIETMYEIRGEPIKQGPNEVTTWTVSSQRPFTADEAADARARMAEVEQISEAGGGRLAGLYEGPDPNGSSSQYTCFDVEYRLANGKTTHVGTGLNTKQKANMRWDEISALRDAGAGEIISQEPFRIGLGKYTVRFTLSDGQTVDLTVNYPPGTRQEREKIFAETRALKQQLRFTVMHPYTGPDGRVSGVLQYTLADGRVVGLSGNVPKEAITPDGKHVAVPDSGQTVEIQGSTGGN